MCLKMLDYIFFFEKQIIALKIYILNINKIYYYYYYNYFIPLKTRVTNHIHICDAWSPDPVTPKGFPDPQGLISWLCFSVIIANIAARRWSAKISLYLKFGLY